MHAYNALQKGKALSCQHGGSGVVQKSTSHHPHRPKTNRTGGLPEHPSLLAPFSWLVLVTINFCATASSQRQQLGALCPAPVEVFCYTCEIQTLIRTVSSVSGGEHAFSTAPGVVPTNVKNATCPSRRLLCTKVGDIPSLASKPTKRARVCVVIVVSTQ
jgi:hypothetical protein